MTRHSFSIPAWENATRPLLAAKAEAYNPIADVERDLSMTRLNDGRCDRNGRFLCGGMSEDPSAPACSNVYSLDPAGSVRTLINNVTCSNSICFSPTGSTMYFSDMPTGEIVAYDYDQGTAEVCNRRVVCDASSAPGLPDGSVVDADGCIWNARWGAGKVVRFTPTGKVDLTFEFPVTNVPLSDSAGRTLRLSLLRPHGLDSPRTSSKLSRTPEAYL
jgi:L-arabinonolactonase